LQSLDIRVLSWLIQFLEVVHDFANDFGQLHSEDEESRPGGLRQGSRLRCVWASSQQQACWSRYLS
jgi:hypothetical protein